jgi:NADPH2:quinone reductase
MRGIQVANPTGGPAGLELIELPIPTLSDPHDIIVKVRAVALNPGDTKMRAMSKAGTVMGMDGAGVVVEAGVASRFAKGDEVLWSFPGEMTRHGSNAEYELVDSRLVGRKPANLPWDEAAAIPLVGLTAWEMFEDKFRLHPDTKNNKEVLLVVNGAGGVGAIAIQLAKKVRYFLTRELSVTHTCIVGLRN